MKKLLALMLALALTLSLAACSVKINPTDDGADKTEPSSGNIWKEDLFHFGTVNGSDYENDLLGYGCALEGWTFADADMIAQLNQIGKDLLTEDVQEAFEKTGAIMDMFAQTEDGLQNINIQFQDMNVLYSMLLSADKLVDMTIPQLPATLEGAGYENINIEKTTVSLGGDEHPAISIVSEIYGVPTYQKEVVVVRKGYAIFIAVTSMLEDNTDALFELFYKLS